MAQAPPLTVIFHGSPRAYRKDDPGLDAARMHPQMGLASKLSKINGYFGLKQDQAHLGPR